MGGTIAPFKTFFKILFRVLIGQQLVVLTIAVAPGAITMARTRVRPTTRILP